MHSAFVRCLPGTLIAAALPAGSGWNLRSAEGINADGAIVGYGTFGGNTRAFLLTPVPEADRPRARGPRQRRAAAPPGSR